MGAERERFERGACGVLREWLRNAKAGEIAEEPMSNAERIALMRQVVFGDVDELEKVRRSGAAGVNWTPRDESRCPMGARSVWSASSLPRKRSGLAGAIERFCASESGSKLRAVHTLRDFGHGPCYAKRMECGGKRSATPLWLGQPLAFPDVPGGRKRRRRFALPPHSRSPHCHPPLARHARSSLISSCAGRPLGAG